MAATYKELNWEEKKEICQVLAKYNWLLYRHPIEHNSHHKELLKMEELGQEEYEKQQNETNERLSKIANEVLDKMFNKK